MERRLTDIGVPGDPPRPALTAQAERGRFQRLHHTGSTSQDRIDRKILFELMRDSTLPVAQRAERVGLSQTPRWERVQKLDAAGVITGRVALVDPDMIGLKLTVFVEIEAIDHTREWRAAFREVIEDFPMITKVHRIAGEVDFLIKIVVPEKSIWPRAAFSIRSSSINDGRLKAHSCETRLAGAGTQPRQDVVVDGIDRADSRRGPDPERGRDQTLAVLGHRDISTGAVSLSRDADRRSDRNAHQCYLWSSDNVGACSLRPPGASSAGRIDGCALDLPTAVAGLALTALFSSNGWFGPAFDAEDFPIVYTTWGIALAMAFSSVPFVVRTGQPVLEDMDPALEQAALTLGERPWSIFTPIVFPAILPAWLAECTTAFARSLGEFGAIVFIAGNLPMKTKIATLLAYIRLEYEYNGAAAIARVLLAFALILLGVSNMLQS